MARVCLRTFGVLALLSACVLGDDDATADFADEDEGVADSTGEPAGTSDEFNFGERSKKEPLTFDDSLPLLKLVSER